MEAVASALAELSRVGTPCPENEIVGAIGAFKALAEASKSGPSSGRPDGGAEAACESRLGLGGGASLRDIGGVESCPPVAGSAVSITPLAESAGAAASGTESVAPDEASGACDAAGSV